MPIHAVAHRPVLSAGGPAAGAASNHSAMDARTIAPSDCGPTGSPSRTNENAATCSTSVLE